jgi:alpha-beta hydrolase superfamily lysophospholipase
LTPARSIPGRTYPVRMSSLKYQVPSPPTPTKFPLKSPRGANLATRVWPARNNNSAKALCLLVHGAGTHSGYFDSLATHLTQHDIFCASYDQVNCGYSDPEPDAPSPGVTHVRNFDCFMEDVCAAIEWMQMEAGTTSAPVFLFGESFGSLQVRCRAYILSQVTLPGGVATKPCLSFDSQCMRCPFWTPVRR